MAVSTKQTCGSDGSFVAPVRNRTRRIGKRSIDAGFTKADPGGRVKVRVATAHDPREHRPGNACKLAAATRAPLAGSQQARRLPIPVETRGPASAVNALTRLELPR
jgi:hypothetical protein